MDENGGLEPLEEDGGSVEVLEPEASRPGTRAWLETLATVEWFGLELPSVHRVPDGATLGEEDGKRCRVVRPDGGRCAGTRVVPWGVCLGHAGGGIQDYRRAASLAAEGRRARARARLTLGIGPRKAADPRAIARIRAHERAEALAAALVDGPLDAPGLSALERQRAAVTALDATFPIQTATVSLELPASPEDAAAMGWQDMRALAARLLEPA